MKTSDVAMVDCVGDRQFAINRARLKLGVSLFVLSILAPVVGIPLVGMLGLPAAIKATVSGALLVGAEVLGVAAVAVMGRPGYTLIKNRVLVFLKRYGLPEVVGRGRYTIGLVLFCLPLIFGWVSVYVAEWIPGFVEHPLPYAVVGDLMLLTSLFVLGGSFWDKVRALFVHDARVEWSQEENHGEK